MPTSKMTCTGCKMKFPVHPRATIACPHCNKTIKERSNASSLLVQETQDPQDARRATLGPEIPRPALPSAQLTSLGQFQIQRRFDAGAFGTVYEAYDSKLERDVALKVPKADNLTTPERVERFLQEAKAAANLHHPNIVPVYEAGQIDGRYYIASAFINGKNLAKVGSDAKRGMPFGQAADIVRQLAEALDYAHERGTIHRDVKPANVMMDRAGRPHLVDFGLAVCEERAEKLTTNGRLVGTPAYMAPEQARGESVFASDQYSLGVVLYELLTGRTPFDGPLLKVLNQLLNEEPPSPRTYRPDIPADLEAIILKCLEKDPNDRYKTCADLAKDLRHYLADEDVSVRTPPPLEWFQRWARREKKLAWAIAATTLSLVFVAAVLAVSAWRLSAQAESERKARGDAEVAQREAEEARGQAEKSLRKEEQANRESMEKTHQVQKALEKANQEEQNALAEKNRAVKSEAAAIKAREEADRLAEKEKALRLAAKRDQYFAQISLADRELRNLQTDQARDLLNQASELDVPVGWEWHYLLGECARRTTTNPSVSAMAFRPVMSFADMKDDWLAWGNDDNEVVLRRRVKDPKEPKDLFRLKAPGRVRCLAFSGDGDYLAAGCEKGQVVVWSLQSQPPKSTKIPTGETQETVSAITLNQDGKQLAYGLADGQVAYIDDTSSAKPTVLPRKHYREIRSVAFYPGGDQLISACQANRVVLRALPGSKEVAMQDKELNAITGLAIHVRIDKESAYFHMAKEGGQIVTYDATNPSLTEEVSRYGEHESDIRRMCTNFNQQRGYGNRIASLDDAGLLRVWQVGENGIVDHHASRAEGSFALNRKGDEIAWVAANNTVVHRIISSSRQSSFRFHFATGRNLDREFKEGIGLDDYAEYTHGIAYSQDSKSLLSASSVSSKDVEEAGEAILWDVRSGKQRRTFKDARLPLWTVDISKEGWIAYGGKSDTIYLVPPGRAPLPRTIRQSVTPVNVLKFDPSGKRLASLHTNGEVNVWRTENQALTSLKLDGKSNAVTLAWSNDGSILAAGNDEGTLTWWTDDLTRKHSIRNAHVGRIWGIVVLNTREKTYLVSGGDDGTIQIRDLAAPDVVLKKLKSQSTGVLALAGSPDGTRLASAGRDKTIRLWEVGTWREVLAIPSRAGLRSGLAFRPDGLELAVATVNGVLRFNREDDLPVLSATNLGAWWRDAWWHEN